MNNILIHLEPTYAAGFSISNIIKNLKFSLGKDFQNV